MREREESIGKGPKRVTLSIESITTSPKGQGTGKGPAVILLLVYITKRKEREKPILGKKLREKHRYYLGSTCPRRKPGH